MVMGSKRLGPLSDWTTNCRPVLSSERALHRNKTARLTVSRKVTSTETYNKEFLMIGELDKSLCD
jgi:hypothetical protein